MASKGLRGDDIDVGAVLAEHLQFPTHGPHTTCGSIPSCRVFSATNSVALPSNFALCAVVNNRTTIGIVAFDGAEQLAGACPLLGGEERFALAVDLRQYLGIQPVGLFLRPVLRLRRPRVSSRPRKATASPRWRKRAAIHGLRCRPTNTRTGNKGRAAAAPTAFADDARRPRRGWRRWPSALRARRLNTGN